jgi:hypothetical protein
MVNMIHLAVPAGFHTTQLDLYMIYSVSDKCGFSYNYFVTEEEDKTDFSIPSNITLTSSPTNCLCKTYLTFTSGSCFCNTITFRPGNFLHVEISYAML